MQFVLIIADMNTHISVDFWVKIWLSDLLCCRKRFPEASKHVCDPGDQSNEKENSTVKIKLFK